MILPILLALASFGVFLNQQRSPFETHALAFSGSQLALIGILQAFSPNLLPAVDLALVRRVASNGDQKALSHRLVSIGKPAFALSLCVNTVVTSLIIFRIWRHFQLVKKHLPGSQKLFLSVISIMVESGVLLFATQLVYLVLFILRHPAYDTVAGLTAVVYVSPFPKLHRIGYGYLLRYFLGDRADPDRSACGHGGLGVHLRRYYR